MGLGRPRPRCRLTFSCPPTLGSVERPVHGAGRKAAGRHSYSARPSRRSVDGSGALRVWVARSGEDYDEGDPTATEGFSRRDFGIGVTLGGIGAIAAWYGPRDDIRSRLYQELVERAPWLATDEAKLSSLTARRRPLDLEFTQWYMDTVAELADGLGIIQRQDLERAEKSVRERAHDLFFPNDALKRTAEDISDPAWFNFVLYGRLHSIAVLTSPLMRTQFVDKLGKRIVDKLQPHSPYGPVPDPQKEAESWLASVESLLAKFRDLGWLSDFRLEEFDGAPGSLWQDEGRGRLAVFVSNPLTMQAAQLLGEEEYEELSPKLSSALKWILTNSGIHSVSFEDYYLDDRYRPDPLQYRPSEFATEFDLSMRN
mmetsp:Transcript_13196/g.32599  ORF Transcript_13196/g.32599 Transcript_13196/m.32599 type:complete len:370 (-) Transcript_13196:41-1150(-)